jgi:hypothetical protein
MKRVITVALLAVLALGLPARAQVTAPTPTPDPLVYNDAAMHFQAPPDAHLIGAMQQPTLDSLSQDPTAMATWVVGRGESTKIIQIVMESFTGSLDGWDSTYENALRTNEQATLVKNKEHMLLQNRMPALFLEITQGAGFQTRKIFAEIWIDSQRGVVLSVTSGLGEDDEQTAKRLLSEASAIRYPSDNDQQ